MHTVYLKREEWAIKLCLQFSKTRIGYDVGTIDYFELWTK